MELKLLKQQINYDEIVTGKDLDLDTYNAKFKMWDYVVENKLLENGDEKAILILQDITIYAYAFFKNDKDEPLKLYPYQDAIGNLEHDFTEDNPNRFILYRSANQIGKSELLCLLAIKHAINGRNKNIVMISKSLDQSHFLLARIRWLLNNSVFCDTWRESLGETANTTILTFNRDEKGKVVNRIICAPVSEGALGYPIHYLFLDELDFYEYRDRGADVFFTGVALPRTNKTKGQVICFSNPNWGISKIHSILYKLWRGDLFKRKFHFRYLDAPWATQTEYERLKRNGIDSITCSTLDGEWSDISGAFFTYAEIHDMLQRDWNNSGLPAVDREVFIALDLGKMYDQSVISIGISKKPLNKDDKYNDLDVIYTEEFTIGTEYDKVANRVIQIRDYYVQNYKGVGGIGFDATGQQTFSDFIRSIGISAMPVDFAKKETNKNLLYYDFKFMAEKRKIKVVYSEKCERQLSGVVYKETETKKLKIEAAKEKIHDDYMDSISILVHIAIKPSAIPVSIISIGPPEKIDDVKPIDTRAIVEKNTILQDRNNYFENKFNEYGGGFQW